MTQYLIVVLTTAYLCVEYGLSTSRRIHTRRIKELIDSAKYFLYYFIVALVLSINWFSCQLILAIIIQAICFRIIDHAKIKLSSNQDRYRLEIAIIDILLHFSVICFSVMILKPVLKSLNFPFDFAFSFSFMFYIKACIYVSAIIFLLNGGTDLVRAVLKKVQIEDEMMEKDNTGKLIGNIERILLFLFILFDNLAAIGFVIAAKSIARFEELKHKKFAEYYLIGTLTSAVIAILMGKLVIFLIDKLVT